MIAIVSRGMWLTVYIFNIKIYYKIVVLFLFTLVLLSHEVFFTSAKRCYVLTRTRSLAPCPYTSRESPGRYGKQHPDNVSD